LPCQSGRSAGACQVIPSHHTPPSESGHISEDGVAESCHRIKDWFSDVPGARQKSGWLIAELFESGLMNVISTVKSSSRQPFGGTIMAKLVLPQELGKAAATYVFAPGDLPRQDGMCSAISLRRGRCLGAIHPRAKLFAQQALPP
jgi:hypothetical protein